LDPAADTCSSTWREMTAVNSRVNRSMTERNDASLV